MLLFVADMLLTTLHMLVVVFILTGWAVRRFRRLHLIVALVTFFSWFILGSRYGWGYCFLTDWTWMVKEARGETGLPASFIEWWLEGATGLDWNTRLVDVLTVAGGLVAFVLSTRRQAMRGIRRARSAMGDPRMLRDTNAIATIAVKDIEAARKFYGQTLGLKEIEREGSEFVSYESGKSIIDVYHSEFAGTNKATAMSWSVDDIEKEVNELKGKGIKFEHYDLPETKREGDIHVGHGMKVAWFKDPDGNILNIAGR